MAQILLSKTNFFYNLDICSSQAGDKNKISIVLKDNAYGHGITQIAQMSKEYGIKKAVVRNIKEAKIIKDYFDQILILADTTTDTLAHCFHITINSLEDIDKIGVNSNIAIKVDTGMHRNGINKKSLKECIYRAYKRNLNIKSVFTHYRSADILSDEYSWQKEQFKALKKITKKICAKLKIPKISFHACNSSALFRENNFKDDYCRIGIAAYGYIENKKPLKSPLLKPVLSLIANRISTRILKKGQGIGYGAGFIAKKDMIVSTYDIGYSDGFSRIDISDKFYTQNGNRLVGNVSMDNISIQGKNEQICIFNDATNLANLHKTITYEILVRLSHNITRQIV